jgi:spermidine/putrescine ABC transporter ATP-binding subunit
MISDNPIIRISGVSKRYGDDVKAVDGVELVVNEGEFFALLGPSGCGKTTLLRMLAGFEVPSSGRIQIDGDDMAGVPPNRRDVNMVFQSYAVFPHMSVFDNVAYGLKVSGVARAQRTPRVERALALVRLEGYGARRPDQLSGGQRQRVALARALVKEPRVLLLDEPLSALDAKLREAMQVELVRLQQAVGITFVIVTHDQDEALSMADRIAVMNSGRVCQIADPATLYESPCSRFVAEFIGKMNVFEARVEGPPGHASAVVDALCGLRAPLDPGQTGTVSVALRPEKVRIGRDRHPGAEGVALEATVETAAYHGSVTHLHLRTAHGTAMAATVTNAARGAAVPRAGEQLTACIMAADLVILTE